MRTTITVNHNFSAVFDAACERHAARTALHHRDREIGYAELARLVDGWARDLYALGVRPGKVVALLLPNSPAFIAAYYATLRLGAIVAPLGILLRPSEVKPRLELVSPTVLVTTAGLAVNLGETSTHVLVTDPGCRDVEPASPMLPAARDAQDIAVLIFTSGTTGTAKAAELTHGGIAWNAERLIEGFQLTSADVQLAVAPFSHVLGMTGVMNAALVTGGGLALQERFDAPAALALMKRAGVTGVMGAPSMFVALVREAQKAVGAPHLRFAHGGGAPFPPEAIRSTSETFECAVREGYGMSEVGGAIALTPIHEVPKPRSVGRPLPGSELRVVDLRTRTPVPIGERGEVQVKSPSVMRGYTGDPAASGSVLSSDGWLSTGDIGYLDRDGHLFLVDRTKELIIRSGYNVYPGEVEEVLLAYSGIVEAAVIGVPHQEHGEEIVALVVASRDQLDLEGVRTFARERLAAYKYPRHVIRVAALPKGPTGKIAKRAIDRADLGPAFLAAPFKP
jgi:long-chain acyl-CoA synthetase